MHLATAGDKDRSYVGAYCVHGMIVALNCLWNSASFEDAVTRTIMMLGDADSTGSIAGQLAGAIYGMRGPTGLMAAHGGRWWNASKQHSGVWDACCIVMDHHERVRDRDRGVEAAMRASRDVAAYKKTAPTAPPAARTTILLKRPATSALLAAALNKHVKR